MWSQSWKLEKYGVLTSKVKDWKLKGIDLLIQLSRVTKGANTVVMEFPEYHQSLGGTVTAKSGSLVKLSWFVGVLSGGLSYESLELVTPTQWKGQLPKNIVIQRIKKRMPEVKAKSHDWDAIGLGLYWKGEMG